MHDETRLETEDSVDDDGKRDAKRDGPCRFIHSQPAPTAGHGAPSHVLRSKLHPPELANAKRLPLPPRIVLPSAERMRIT